MNRLEEINNRKKELRNLAKEENADLDAIEKELNDLETEERSISDKAEKRAKLLGRIVEGEGTPVDESRKVENDLEKRGATIKEKRAVTLVSSGAVLEKKYSRDIQNAFDKMSTLADLVDSEDLEGGESYTIPYEKSSTNEADYTEEGTAYSEGDKKFGYAEIKKTKLTKLIKMTEELLKLPNAKYAERIISEVRKAFKRKLNNEILNGDGAAGHITGIFNSDVLSTSDDIEISTINENTLDEIIFAYGSDEEVETEQVLILNKLDVRAFKSLKDKQGRPYHKVEMNGNTGYIDTVPFVINSKAKAFSKATAGEFTMAYGSLSDYKLTNFSGIDVKMSEDEEFSKGINVYRGSLFAGGNVKRPGAFVRVKKVAAE